MLETKAFILYEGFLFKNRMDTSLRELFEYHANNIMNELYELEHTHLTNRDILFTEDEFTYNKQIDLEFTPSKLSLNIAFTDHAYDYFKNQSEEFIQKYYSQMNLNLLYSNILGIIIHTIYLEIKSSSATGLEYHLPKVSTLRQLLLHKDVYSYEHLSIPIVYLGFTFND